VTIQCISSPPAKWRLPVCMKPEEPKNLFTMYTRIKEEISASPEPLSSRFERESILYNLQGAVRGAERGMTFGILATIGSLGMPNVLGGLMCGYNLGPAAAACGTLFPTMGFTITQALKGLVDPGCMGIVPHSPGGKTGRASMQAPDNSGLPAPVSAGPGTRIKGAVKGFAEGVELGMAMNISGLGWPSLLGGMVGSVYGSTGLLIGAHAFALMGGIVTGFSGFAHPEKVGIYESRQDA
jgi:hypothetical protein